MTKTTSRNFAVVEAPFTMFKIQWDGGGGSVPSQLEGSFTSKGVALEAIERFNDAKVANVAANKAKYKKKP